MRSRHRSFVASARLGLAVAAVALGGIVASPSTVAAQTPNPLQRGPAPTHASLEAAAGPFAVQSVIVPRQSTFGGGTIYYPTDTSQGTYGVLAVSPGFISPQSVIQWTGPRVASHGFVVITIDTLGLFDFPWSRAAQLKAALTYVTQSSPAAVRQRVDATRLAVSGHSMGGGGTLEAARDNPTYQAAVALQPWDIFQTWGGVRVPSMIIGAQNDAVAGVAGHSEPMYQQIPATTEKAYLEVAGADHFLGAAPNNPQAKLMVAWLKRYVDNDTRYEQFICPPPSGPQISEYRNTCPG
jgi:predicted dienelactone hydrolase